MTLLTVREAAVNTLLRIYEDGTYSNIAVDEQLRASDWNEADRRLFTSLVYGTLQHRDTLDFYLAPYVRHDLQPDVREILRVAMYQIAYLTKVPSHAAVNEAVQMAKERHFGQVGGLVNGILRNVLRHPLRSFDEIEDPIERLAVETSHPIWLIRRWYYQYGFTLAEKIAKENNVIPPTTARVNTLKGTREEVLALLDREGFRASASDIVPVSIHAEKGNFGQTEAFQQGYLSIQDESSMLPVVALDPQPNETVLDVCAAPGGKTAFIAEKMNDTGKVYAHDIYDHKIATIRDQATRLGIHSMDVSLQDGRQLSERYEERTFDRILIDAPCSGFGVIRRKPEIKYERDEQSIQQLAHLQWQIVQSAIPLLKEGGRLVYSTCTIDRLENDKTVEKIVKHFPELQLVDTPLQSLLETSEQAVQIYPHTIESDGFFIAALEKKS